MIRHSAALLAAPPRPLPALGAAPFRRRDALGRRRCWQALCFGALALAAVALERPAALRPAALPAAALAGLALLGLGQAAPLPAPLVAALSPQHAALERQAAPCSARRRRRG